MNDAGNSSYGFVEALKVHDVIAANSTLAYSESLSVALDCFAPLAMTLRGRRKSHPVIATSPCDETIQRPGMMVAGGL